MSKKAINIENQENTIGQRTPNTKILYDDSVQVACIFFKVEVLFSINNFVQPTKFLATYVHGKTSRVFLISLNSQGS